MNDKLVVIINGRGGVGKDTLCGACCTKYSVHNISAIDPIKEIAYANGWNGEKDEKSRKLLHDLKEAFVAYNDLPTNHLVGAYHVFLSSNAELLFVHIREPKEIRKFEEKLNTPYITVLVQRHGMDKDLGNDGDDHVEEYPYDFIYHNDLDIDRSRGAFVAFIDKIWWNVRHNAADILDIDWDKPESTMLEIPAKKAISTDEASPVTMRAGEMAKRILNAAGNVTETIPIIYHDSGIEKLTYVDGKSDWIDLRAAEDVEFMPGDIKLIPLGISMKLPDGYEAHVLPRSSTFKNYGLLQTNACGIINEGYCGTNDIGKWPAYATRKTTVHKNDRICQFRIEKNQPRIEFHEVDRLDGEDRGGFRSTGT